MAPAQRLNGNATDSEEENNDECPICHSTRYLRRDMRFLINPDCYHKMCESCVDRIFSHGPAPCPVAGCRRKNLRRNKFRPPTFDDLRMEREVDIRKRMANIFNRREDDFETLRAYNDYLGNVEDMTFNLVNGIEVEETNKKVLAYEAKNSHAIHENQKLAIQELEEQKSRRALEEERTRLRRAADLEEEEVERREVQLLRNSVISRLATGSGNAHRIAREGEIALRRAGQKKELASTLSASVDDTLSFQGLKKKVKGKPEVEKPYDPFDGMSIKKDYIIMPDMLPDVWVDYLGPARKDPKFTAGGYSLQDFFTRALGDLYGGFDVLIGQEKKSSRIPGAAQAGKEVVMTDVFA
jgi:CDK-activating kinase assembly factor MAT1